MIRYTQWLMWLVVLLATPLVHAGTKHYYYTDPQGTPLAKADASGNITARFEYTPYGMPVTSMGSAPDGVGYTGHVNDPETGLVYMQARYYDAEVGRFLSVDPVRGTINGGNFNAYTYALGNPTRYIDPDGKQEQEVDLNCRTLGCTNPALVNANHQVADGASVTGDLMWEGYKSVIIPVPKIGFLGKLAEKIFGRTVFGAAAREVRIASGKFDYMFGRVSSNVHNRARSTQLAADMKRLGVADTSGGRQMLAEHFASAVKNDASIIKTFSNEYGKFEVRESFFIGPSGRGAAFQSTFKILDNGARELSAVILLH